VAKAVDSGILEGLANVSPLQRLSIYADDVVLFFRPARKEIAAVKEILYLFGEASGLRPNFRKTTATVIRGSEEEKARVQAILGCQHAEFPIKYLGLQLALRPLTRAQWMPILDSVVHIIPAWQRSMITRASRLILVKTVVAARPVHHMLVEAAPGWLLEEVAKCMRAFFWAGKKEINGGQCLVAWDSVCKPLRLGGLGIKNLRLQGLALRVRWEWLQRTDPTRPWKGLRMANDRQAGEVFNSLATVQVGDGRQALFWKDRWLSGRTAEEVAPAVTALVTTRTRNRRSVQEGLINNAWLADVATNLTVEGTVQCLQLWEAIEGVDREHTEPDKFSWTGANNGQYTAKSTYKMLWQGTQEYAMYKPIWRSYTPLKCKIFGWLALKHRLWTSDRRHRHGLQDQTSACFTCLQEEDTVEHILVQCPYARQTWFECFIAAGLNIREPTTESKFEDWWSCARELVAPKNRRGFDTLALLIAWSLWKQRNARAFNNQQRQLTVHQLVERIKDEFELWRLARVGGSEIMPRE
jgi:hypothetical protein